MKLAVILVSYNTRGLLRQALASIDSSARSSGLDRNDIAVVVVDNASSDGSATMVEREFPSVRVVALTENAGFTRANNLALASLGFRVDGGEPISSDDLPEYVLLLNPDAELIGDALGRLMTFMSGCPSAGACGPRLEYANGSFQHGAFRFPSVMQVALDLFPLHRLPAAGRIYNSEINGRYPAMLWDGQDPFPVDFVLGASLFMRGAAIQQIGGLDEGYFMYCEEMDWCLRLANVGLDTFAVPTARVVHHEAQSSSQAPWSSLQDLWRSRIRFYTKHRESFPRGQLLLVRILLRIAMRLRSRRARRRFAHGMRTGVETAGELAAYATVARL